VNRTNSELRVCEQDGLERKTVGVSTVENWERERWMCGMSYDKLKVNVARGMALHRQANDGYLDYEFLPHLRHYALDGAEFSFNKSKNLERYKGFLAITNVGIINIKI